MRVGLALLLLAAATPAEEYFRDKVAVLEPFDRTVARGKGLTLEGQVKRGFKTPELIIIAPDGKTYRNTDNVLGEYDFTFRVRFEHGFGPYRMEVMAHTHAAIRSAARFTIWYGKRPQPEAPLPPIVEVPTPVEIDPLLAEKRFRERLNAFRRSIGVDPVGWNEAVAARAREHARKMALAARRQHRFGGIGPAELLARDGAGMDGASGSSMPWTRISTTRPFDRPALQLPDDDVRNHVVTFVHARESLAALFEEQYVREAAFRLCAADPYCLEVGVGAVRAPPAARSGPPSPLVYYCVCFIQVNDKLLKRAQDEAYDDLLKQVRDEDPELLRRLGAWGRGGRAEKIIARAWKDDDPAVAGAALDAWLLLDEDKARAAFEKCAAESARQRELRDWADAWAAAAPLRHVGYDTRIRDAGATLERRALDGGRAELAEALRAEGDARAKALDDLARRARGTPLAAEIDAAR